MLTFLARQARRVMDLVTVSFGFVTLVAVLAVVASIPVVQLVSLGYLLEAEGRVARTGRIWGALPGLRTLARLGGAALGLFLTFLPWLIVADFRHDSILIDPSSRATRNLGVAYVVFAVLGSVHASLTLLRGGRFFAFFRPFKNARWAVARLRAGEGLGVARVPALIRSFDLPHYFVLGFKGFAAALLWIALPTALLAVGARAPAVALLGGLLLTIFVIPLPLLQARLAAEGRFKAGFELREVWHRFRRAPLSALVALVLTLAFALPLYLLKIELIPRDARWLAAAVFLLTILPTKLIAGKAYARGAGEGRAFLPLRTFAALAGLAAAGFYALFLFGTRYVEWRGALGLFEQHAFLVPVAFY